MSLRFPFSPRWDAGQGMGGRGIHSPAPLGGTRGRGWGLTEGVEEGARGFPFSRVVGEGVRGWGLTEGVGCGARGWGAGADPFTPLPTQMMHQQSLLVVAPHVPLPIPDS